MSLETRIEQVEGRVPISVLRLDGELDASNFESVVDTVRAAYDAGARALLIDLSGLTFMASSGLVALHSIVRIMQGDAPLDPELGWSALHAEIGDRQAAVQLSGPQPAVERVLSRTGLDRLFHVHPDRDAAIAAF
ncbi:MAG TPA: STAS domain-containing protein [Clostridia bacterium]|nr:STAS domain-containing protein [Clostridia bacterium]